MKLRSAEYENLADHCYGRTLDGAEIDLHALIGKSVAIEGVEYIVLSHVNRLSGYQGTIYQRIESGSIVVAHRGTEFDRQPVKDGLIADGGMLAARSNAQARDAIELTRDAILQAKNHGERWSAPTPEVSVTDHSAMNRTEEKPWLAIALHLFSHVFQNICKASCPQSLAE